MIRAQRSRIGALQSPLAPSEGEPGTVTVNVQYKYIYTVVYLLVRGYFCEIRYTCIGQARKLIIDPLLL